MNRIVATLKMSVVVLTIIVMFTGCIKVELPGSKNANKTISDEEAIETMDEEKAEEVSDVSQVEEKALNDEEISDSEEKEKNEIKSSAADKSGIKYMLYSGVSESEYTDIEPMFDCTEDQRFTLTFNNELNATFESIEAYIKVYSDIECTDESRIFYDTDKDYTTNTVVIKPKRQDEAEEMRAFENSNYIRSWGGYTNYYMVISKDMTSEEFIELEKPQRMLFTIKSEIRKPEVECYVSDTGFATLDWEAVEGANEYIIYQSKYGSIEEYTRVTDTLFDTFHLDRLADGSDPLDENYVRRANEEFENIFYITSIVNGKESRLSNQIDTRDYMEIVPESGYAENIPYNMSGLSDELPKESEVYMKSYDPMIIKQYPIEYDFLNVMESTKDPGVIGIGYMIKGTPFRGVIVIDSYDEDLANELHIEQTERLRNTGVLEDQIIAEIEEVEEVADEKIVEDIDLIETLEEVKEPEKISLEQVITEALLNNLEAVDLSLYPAASNFDYLKDLIFTIYSQNPYIMYEKGFRYDQRNKTLYLNYDSVDTVVIEQKREEIYLKVDQIISEVVRDSMSDYEKEMALHDYLVDNVEYDFGALDNAEANDFKFVSEEFYDSFNPYGILINNKGVCQSYAESFKLLCDRARIDCIVVNGLLGSTPHAWNKVNIEGSYYNIDLTNNDAGIPYPVFNVEDKWVAENYTEGDQFSMDDLKSSFATINNDFDYYVLNNKAASTLEEFSDLIIEGIKNKEETIYVKLLNEGASEEAIVEALRDIYDDHNLKNMGYQDFLSTSVIVCEY